MTTRPPRPDRFGRVWDTNDNELCRICGQPDSCGDCNHQPITDAEARQLGILVEPDPDNSGECVECGARVFAPNGLCNACRSTPWTRGEE